MLLRIAMLTILPLYAQAPAPKPPAQIYAEVRESVVLIKGAQKAGSGVIVSLDGLVVTNYHVVAGEKEIWIKLASGLQLATDEVVAADPGSDLAVLKLNGKGFKPAPLGDSDMIAPGDSIVVISNPLGLEASVTNGLISGIRGEGAHRLFQISAPISPGSSGGPVFNQQGSVIGVATATIQGAQNLNLAVPSSAIRSLLNNPKQAKLADLVPANDDSRRSESVSPILQRVGTYLAKDMIEEAETQLRGGIQQYEFEPLLRLELAKLLIRTGRPQEAVQQLRITNKLTPDAWLPMALIAHLYMKRWLGDGDLSDRRTAYQTYASLLSNRELPSIKHQLIAGMLERMRSPEGTWTTNDRQRSYSVTAKQSGGFLMGFPTEDFKRMISQPAAQLLQNAPSYLAFAPYDAEFNGTNESGKFIGTSSYIDAACGYKQALQIDVSRDGTSMELTGTITQVTGVLRYLSDAMGKKRVQQMCKKPGTEGLRLTLYRVRAKELFFELDAMLNTDMQPLASGGK